MTNQPKDNEWIHKSFRQFMYELGDMDIPVWFDKFKQAILDNLPQSISREAVEKLREKRNKIDNEYADTGIGHFVKDLDALLCNQKDD